MIQILQNVIDFFGRKIIGSPKIAKMTNNKKT